MWYLAVAGFVAVAVAGFIYVLPELLLLPPFIAVSATLILIEALFMLDRREKPRDRSAFWFSAQLKAEALLDLAATAAAIGFLKLCVDSLPALTSWIIEVGPYALSALQWMVAILSVVGAGYLWIKVSAMRYKTEEANKA